MESDEESVTIIVRLIRSFEYRNVKNIVLKNIPLSWTSKQLQDHINNEIPRQTGLPPPFKKHSYDTLKIEHHAHGAKSNDPVINREDDDKLILQPEIPLRVAGVRHETEISYFNLQEYLDYKANPIVKWE